jgi:hypothetical protein
MLTLTSVQFFFLCSRKDYRVWICGDAIPDFFKYFEPLLYAEREDFLNANTHDLIVHPFGSLAKTDAARDAHQRLQRVLVDRHGLNDAFNGVRRITDFIFASHMQTQSTFLAFAGTTSLPFAMIGCVRSTTPTGVPAFEGNTVIVIWSPALK